MERVGTQRQKDSERGDFGKIGQLEYFEVQLRSPHMATLPF